MQVTGKNSANILQKWKESEPRLYYGIVSSETPNHFVLLGPNTVSEKSLFRCTRCEITMKY